MKKTRAQLQRFQASTIAAAQQDMPAAQIRDQLRGGAQGVLPSKGDTGSGYTPAAHDHTTSSDGGVLTNDAHDGYSVYQEISAPSSPSANTARVYSKDKAGITELFYKNSSGTERDLSTSAGLVDTGNATYLDFTNASAPSTPASGKTRIYTKTDKSFYQKDDAGVETAMAGGSGSTIYTSAYASPPGSPADGDIWIPSDSPYTAYRVSSAWVWRYKGGAVNPPDLAGFSWVNQGSAVLTANGGAQHLLAPANATSNLRLRVGSIPAATFIFRVGLARGHWDVNFASVGIVVRDSVGGRLINLAIHQSGGVMIQQYTGFTSGFNFTEFGPQAGYTPDYLEIEEDATTRYFRVGRMGLTTELIYSHTISTSWLTSTAQAGFYVDSNNGTYAAFMDVFDLHLA